MDPGPHSENLLDMFPFREALVLLPLLIIRFFILCSESALILLNDADIEAVTGKNARRGRIIKRLLNQPKRLAATFAVVNTFLASGIIFIIFRFFCAFELSFRLLIVLTALATLLLAVFTDIVPKLYAASHKYAIALGMADILMALNYLFAPADVPLRKLSSVISRRFHTGGRELSANRLSQALELTHYGNANPEEHRLLEGIITFGTTEARQVMTPRIDIFTLPENDSYTTVLAKIMKRGLSRIPVYRDTIDTITGVLFVKDLIPFADSDDADWLSLVRTPFFVPETIKLDNLLREFQEMKNHLAVVVDEHGATAGIITLQDILEEIVGDISDEFDDESLVYSCIDNRNFLFDGKLGLKDFYRITGIEEEPFEKVKAGAESLAGFVMEVAGFFPEKGSKINFNGNIFTVESVDRGRIRQIKCTLADEIT